MKRLIVSLLALSGCGVSPVSNQDIVTASLVFDGEYDLVSSNCVSPASVLEIELGVCEDRPDLNFAADLAKPYDQRKYLFEEGVLNIPEEDCQSQYRKRGGK